VGIGAATSQQKELFEDYEGFVEKFKPKKTTDDCYTPPEIYEIVAEWVHEKYGVDRADMVRPFYPGGDFEQFDYPKGCCVVDNPPFSILAKIKRFYLENSIHFFIFAPTLVCFSGKLTEKLTHVVCACDVVYENGAEIPTSFVTNMGGDVVAESEPELTDRINAVSDRLRKAKKRHVPKHEYPKEIITAARLNYLAKHHTRLQIRRGDCAHVSRIDANPNGIYGGGVAPL
jgi:hypothetical protein